MLYFQNMFFHVPVHFLVVLLSVLGFSTMGPIIFYAVSQKHLYPDWKARLKFLPVLTMLGSGISLSNTKAWLEGVLGKKSSFVRTPKLGITSEKGSNVSQRKQKYGQHSIDRVFLFELFTVFYILLTIAYSSYASRWLVLPYLFIYLAGFSYITFLGFSDYFTGFFDKRKETKRKRSGSGWMSLILDQCHLKEVTREQKFLCGR